jgi:hypothetical protein
MELTLTQIIEAKKRWQQDVISDLNSDWIEDADRRKMQNQLLLLNASIANLELIREDVHGQIFNSAIPF